MAYVVSSKSTQGSAGSITVSIPPHVANDVIIWFVSGLNINTITSGPPAGWQSIGSLNTSGAADNYCYYQRVVTPPLADPTITFSGTSFNPTAICAVIRGADVSTTTSAVDTFGQTTSSAAWSVTSPALTLTSANSLVLLFTTGERDTEDPFLAAGESIDVQYTRDNNSTHSQIGFGYTYSPGTTSPTYTAYTAGSSAGDIGIFCIGIVDDGNGKNAGYPVKGAATLVNVNLGDHGETVSGQVDISNVSFTPQTTSITSNESGVTQNVVSDNFDASAEGAVHKLFPNPLGLGTRANAAESPDLIVNTVELSGTVDLSSAKLAISYSMNTNQIDSLDNLGRIIGFGDNTNASFFLFDGIDSTVKSALGIQCYVLDTSTTGYEIETKGAGSLSWSSVKHIMHGIKPTNYNGTDGRFGPLYILNTMQMVGGSSDVPCSFDDCAKAAINGALNTVTNQSGQTDGQFYAMQDISIGDGTSNVYWVSQYQSFEFPKAYNYDLGVVQVQADAAAFELSVYATAGSTVDLDITTINCGNFHKFTMNALTSTSATYSFDSCNVLNATPTLQGIGNNTYSGLSLIGCKELSINGFTSASTINLGGVAISNCVDTYAVTVTNQDELEALQNVTFTGNNYSIRITGNHGGSTWSLTGATVSGGTGSYDIEYTGTGALTITADAGSGWSTSRSIATGGGSITISATPITFTVNSSESGSDIKIFTTNTQTIEASATGTSASTTNTGTYDWTVQKAGFLPQRGTGVVLGSSDVTVDVTLVEDPVYNSSHGLTFTTDYSYDASTRIMTIVANQEGRDLYSALIDDFISQTALRNCPFPLVAVGPDRIDFKAVGYYNTATTVGATIDSGDIQFWKGAGMEWEHDTTGNPTKKFYSIKSANTLQAGTVVGYTQINNGTPVEATLVSNQVNQVIQFFEDTDGNGTPDYNYTGHLLFKGLLTGYYQARWDVINDSGVTSLEPYEYTINLLQSAIAGTTGDQAITISTLTDHTGAPTVVGGKSFDYELVDPGASSAGDLLAQYNYDIYTAVNTSISGTVYTSYQAFDLPDLMIESGSNFETERGYFEGDGAVTDLSGVYVSQSGGDHPGFTRFQSNDGTYYVPTVVSSISITGMPTAGANIRLQITNETAKTASAWQATTAYALGDKVLRTTGVGAENTAGLYFVATTAGTTGGTEPTWNTTPGGTTSDGTVTWTTYKILYYDADPASASYANTYVDGEEFDTGDTFGIRFAELNGATSFKTFDTTGVVSSTGFTVVVNETEDSVYATNAVDGSSAGVTGKFTADYANDEIDLDANQDFAATEAFAYYCYELTTSQGMYQFWGAVTAVDEANYRINTSVVSIYFDETAGFVKQTDSARIFRSDGARPALDPTTGGNGIEINWRNPVYGYDAGGGGFTAGDRATLDAAATAAALTTVSTNVDAILVDTGTTLPASLTAIEGKLDTVDTVVDSILVDTGTTLPATLTTIEGKVDTVDTNVDSILVDTGTSLPAQITSATSGLSTFDPATDALEGSETYDQSLRIMRSALAGKSGQSGTTETFRDAADTKDRITATVDENGQRTEVTTDGT